MGPPWWVSWSIPDKWYLGGGFILLIASNSRLVPFSQSIYDNTISIIKRLHAVKWFNTLQYLIYCFVIGCIQRRFVANTAQLAVNIVTRHAVIDAIAVTNVAAILRAIPPNRMLHEPWKCRRKARVELAGVDLAGHDLQNVGAIAGLVAPWPILMARIEPI
jgi:hypothetical protein